ncbi:hypothetical protein [Arthrobacter sp. I3]|uniref:hypothetical protein n=1 Tax=Arthrobacter sp. I3 TaxID=218158 RepID=UPI0004800061|nr:hypothetical protein [Arthrobacter sp. I3]
MNEQDNGQLRAPAQNQGGTAQPGPAGFGDAPRFTVDKKTGKKNEAVLGPFTIRDLTVFGSTLLLFIASLIPMFAFAYNLWNLGSLFFLGLGIVLPLIVTALFVARRLSPSTKIRIGSLSIDQFASVVASFTLAFFFLAAAGAFVPSMLIALLGALGLFAATVLGRWIPFFAGDFLGREDAPAHVVAREAVVPVRKPRAPKAPKQPKQPKESKLTKDAAGAGAAGAGASLAAASGPVASRPVASGEAVSGAAASGAAAGWAKRPATGSQAATAAATTPAGTPAGASSVGAASAAAPSAAVSGAPETQISGVVPTAGPASTDSSTAPTQAPAPESAPSAADKTRTAGVPAAAAAGAAAGAAAQTAPAAEQTQAAGVPAATGGSAPTTVNPQVRPQEQARPQEPIGATVDPASRPAEDDVHPVHEAFWFAVAQPRTAVDVRTGAPAFVIEPGGWVLALEDRGNEFLVQHTDGRLGLLRDLSNIERG